MRPRLRLDAITRDYERKKYYFGSIDKKKKIREGG